MFTKQREVTKTKFDWNEVIITLYYIKLHCKQKNADLKMSALFLERVQSVFWWHRLLPHLTSIVNAGGASVPPADITSRFLYLGMTSHFLLKVHLQKHWSYLPRGVKDT